MIFNGGITQNYTGTSAASTINANSVTTGNGLVINANAITSGNALSLVSNSNAGTAAGGMLAIARAGANSAAGQFIYGMRSNVTTTGTTSTNIAVLGSASGATTNYGIYASASGGTNNYGLYVNTGTTKLALAAGTVTSDAGGNLTVSSDERLKDIQGFFNRGLAEIMNIEPISYKWNSLSGMETNGTYSGFSAQNIQGLIPEAVGVDERGYLSLSDRPIIAATVNAIKEQQTQIEGINLKTDNSVTTVNGLKNSIDEQLIIANNKFAATDTLILDLDKNVSALNVKTDANATRIDELQAQMDLILQQNQALTDLATALDVKSLIYKDSIGNLDLLDGKLVASEVETGILTINVVDPTKSTIGQATIKKVTIDADKDGIDDVTGSDGKTVEVKTGAVGSDSKVFTSFVKNPGSFNWVEKTADKDTGEFTGFKIYVEQPVKDDVSADWWIVESKK
jgi:hypothetical protein